MITPEQVAKLKPCQVLYTADRPTLSEFDEFLGEMVTRQPCVRARYRVLAASEEGAYLTDTCNGQLDVHWSFAGDLVWQLLFADSAAASQHLASNAA